MSTAMMYCMKTTHIFFRKISEADWLKKNEQKMKNYVYAFTQIPIVQHLSFLSQTYFFAWVNNTGGLRPRCTLFSQSISQGWSDHLSLLLLWLALPHSILLWQLHPLGVLFISLHPLQHIQSQRKKKRHKTSHIKRRKNPFIHTT